MRSTFQRQILIAILLTSIISVSLWWLGFPPWLAYLSSINGICFAFYGWDKWRAVKQKSRTAESTLHSLALAGGVIGAWSGQKVFRHKTVKRSFQWIFWSIAILQGLAVLTWGYVRFMS